MDAEDCADCGSTFRLIYLRKTPRGLLCGRCAEVAEQVEASVAAERERCASLVDNTIGYVTPNYRIRDLAAAIRRGDQPGGE